MSERPTSDAGRLRAIADWLDDHERILGRAADSIGVPFRPEPVMQRDLRDLAARLDAAHWGHDGKPVQR